MAVEIAQLLCTLAIVIALGWVIWFLRNWSKPDETPATPDLDDEDIALLTAKDAKGELLHKLCVYCAGWHVPPISAVGCPRIKSADLTKHQEVLRVEYWDTWDTSRTIFPWMIDLPVEEVAIDG